MTGKPSAAYDYCKIYADVPIGRDSLAELVGSSLESTPDRFGTILTEAITVDVRKNDDYSAGSHNFVYWPYYLDVSRAESASDEAMRDAVSRILQVLWGRDVNAVAACEFEDELPALGGHERR